MSASLPPREPVKHWRTVAKAVGLPVAARCEEHQEHDTPEKADEYATAFLREHPDGEVLHYKFETRSTARLVIEKDGGRTAT